MSSRDAADRPKKGTLSFNVLGWWSSHETIFHLMSKADNNYLEIQATSCASKRTSSTGGSTVITQRTKLDPTNVHYLEYCKENLLPKLKLARPRLEDEEEKEFEEQYQDEDE